MALTDEANARTTYDAASTHFDALGFWDRYGKRTVARLGLRHGARVLDVCCGTGASAIPAARAVGPLGSVVGLDLSPTLLRRARDKAARLGLGNVELRVGDMTDMAALRLPDASFDAVVIVFGIFFAADMAAQVRALLRLVRPGGVLAITTWGPLMFEPLHTPFLEAVRSMRPDIQEYRPWARLTTEDAVAALMRDAGVPSFVLESESGLELVRPEDWWTIVLGTGLRWYVDQLGAKEAEAVRAECLRRARNVRAIETNVIYTIIEKERA